MENIDPQIIIAIVTVLGGVLAGGVTPLVMNFFQRKKADAEAEREKAKAKKIGFEGDQIERKLERGEIADVIQFIDSFYQMFDEAFCLMQLVDRILAEHPEINGDTRIQIIQRREHITEIVGRARDYFIPDAPQ
jgi:hypothetical protein